MAKMEYKTEHFGCMFSTAGGIRAKIQEIADRNAAEGWTLHSWQIPGATASFCVMVFSREGAS